MNLLQKFLTKLNGLHYHQEYLCFALETFSQPLFAYLISRGRVIKDITVSHLFVGYNPLIFIFTNTGNNNLTADIEIIFSQHKLQQNDLFEKKDVLCRLSLTQVRKQESGSITIFYYEGTHGSHNFLSAFHQFVIGLHNRLYNNKPGNVYLSGNLYDQVQIAYAVPRNISLITVSNNQLYNLFPTDLHGKVNDEYYISSLRHDGKACKQVEQSGKIVISQVDANAYKTVYSLGKNHMQDQRSKDNFPFGDFYSEVLHLPLPQSVLSYHELEVKESWVHGIHKIFLYKILSCQTVKNEPATLAHIHNCYATWRHNHKLQDNYLLR